MPVTRIVEHHTGRSFAFGYRPSPPELLRTRRFFRNYATPALPNPPHEVNYQTDAMASLSQMMGNDQYGDCVEAYMSHQVGIWTGNANGPAACQVYTENQTLAEYYAINGTTMDNGTDPIVALNYWKAKGFASGSGSHKIAGWLAIDPTNWQEIRQAIWLFGGAGACMELPDAYTNPFPAGSGFRWIRAGAPDLNQGHCFGLCGYRGPWARCDTWGMTGWIRNGALAYYCADAQYGALYCAVSADWISKAKSVSPTGLNFAQLEADFGLL
jgi:hypothetical protein